MTGWIWIRCLIFFSSILASLLILIDTRVLETHATQRLHGLLSSKLQLNWRINISSSSLVTIRFELLLLNSHGLFFLITNTVGLPNPRMAVVEFLLQLGVAMLSTRFDYRCLKLRSKLGFMKKFYIFILFYMNIKNNLKKLSFSRIKELYNNRKMRTCEIGIVDKNKMLLVAANKDNLLLLTFTALNVQESIPLA